MSGSDYTLTTNLQLYKPNYDADAEQWGNHLNANADILDQRMVGSPYVPIAGNVTVTAPISGPTANPGNSSTQYATTAFVQGAINLAPHLPITGGTISPGPLTVSNPSASSSSVINLVGPSTTTRYIQGGTATAPRWRVELGDATPEGANTGGNFRVRMFHDDGASVAVIGIDRAATSTNNIVNLSGGLVAGFDWCFKPGGGSWSASSSELRTMFVTDDYTSGLDAILSLSPVLYRSRGNVAFGQGETVRGDTTTEYVGLVADSVETVMPEMVKRVAARIDNRPVNDLLTLDLSALPLALINAIKELHARVVALEERV